MHRHLRNNTETSKSLKYSYLYEKRVLREGFKKTKKIWNIPCNLVIAENLEKK